MFWKRENKIKYSSLGPILQVPVPAKKEFNAMFELLKDAEKYDHSEDFEVSDMILKDLVTYINNYIKK